MRRGIFIFIFLILNASLPAQAAQSDDLTVKLAVFGPGNRFYAWWGHIILIIEDKHTGRDVSYDFGVFSDDNRFFTNIIPGNLIYTCEAMPVRNNINYFQDMDCSVTMYTLDLPPGKKEEIKRLAETAVLPANRDYFYNFFNDNCSTRIRDIIDIAAGGQFKEKFNNEISTLTPRQLVSRFLTSPVTEWVFSFFMGRDNDRKATVWETMFLPSELEKGINSFFYTDEHGVRRKLVSDTEVYYLPQNGFNVPEIPEKPLFRSFFAGLAAAFIIFMIFLIRRKYPVFSRTATGIFFSLFSLLFGGLGLLLFFLSFFTNHDYTRHNINLVFCNPLHLAGVPLGIIYTITKKNKTRSFVKIALRFLSFFVVIGIIVSMFIELFPAFWQDNLSCQMLMFPAALVFLIEFSGLLRKINFNKNRSA